MIIDYNGNIAIITQENATIIELVKKLQTLYPKFENNNIIVHLTTLKTLAVKDIVEFLVISNMHRDNKHSFVIVRDNLDLDELPDQLVVVPTLQEAYDMIEMEDMERDLGF